MRLAVAGGTGLVGRFVVEQALAVGDEVRVLGRRPPPPGVFSAAVEFRPLDLKAASREVVAGCDALVHAAFHHVPGRYRGGEGGDPEGFLKRNVEGSRRLFDAAVAAGVRRIVFLSSRAVYGTCPPGTELTEDMPLRPDTLYGEAKLAAERDLAALSGPGCLGISLRVTGVYGPGGPGRAHKWSGLMRDALGGASVAPRVATEVHGDDVAAAVRLALTASTDRLVGGVFNVSDLVLDRRDLLAAVAEAAGRDVPLPPRGDAGQLNVMRTDRLRSVGWRPGGWELLRQSLPGMLASCGGWTR